MDAIIKYLSNSPFEPLIQLLCLAILSLIVCLLFARLLKEISKIK